MVRRLALIAFVTVAGSGAARGNALETFGFDPRAVSMGGAQVASAEDFTASFYNPAMMSLSKEIKFGFGFAWAQPVMDVAPVVMGQESRVQAATPPDYGGFSLGVLFPLAGKVQNRVALGLGLYLPSNNLLRTEAVDPKTPSWYLYHSSPNRIVVNTGVSVRLHEYFSVGAGVAALANFGGGVDFKVDLFSKEFEKRSIRNDLENVAAPIAGFLVNLTPINLRIAGSYRGEMQLDYALPTVIDMGEIGSIDLNIAGVAHYTPHIFSLGAQYATLEEKLTLAAEIRYAMWSRAPNPALTVAMDLSGDAIDSLGLADALDLATDDGSPGFSDTVAAHFGAEYKIGDRFAVRGGYFFRPTPVPRQIGDTNLLDGDTHGISLGAGFNFDDPLEVFQRPIHIHLAAQRLIIPERVAEKPAANVLPSYAYGGHVNNVSAALRYEF